MTPRKLKVVEDLDKSRVLSAEDLFSGGEEPIKRLELPMIVKDGQPGIVFTRMLTTEEVEAHRKIKDEDQQTENMLLLLSTAVCSDLQGTPMFTSKDDPMLGKIPFGAQLLMMNTILGEMGVDVQVGGEVEDEKKG